MLSITHYSGIQISDQTRKAFNTCSGWKIRRKTSLVTVQISFFRLQFVQMNLKP
ncbi:hypothetical protein DOY81_003253, partial [Sarcophaga bullata]